MKICPTCRDEFLQHIEICTVCDVALVSHEEAFSFPKESFLSKEELLKDAAIFMEAGLNQCLELEKILLKSKISCGIYPASENCDSNSSTLGASCDMKYLLLVATADVERAKNALEGQFIAQIAKEGKGQFVTDIVDLNQNIITCPACGESNELKNGECPACGLGLDIQALKPE